MTPEEHADRLASVLYAIGIRDLPENSWKAFLEKAAEYIDAAVAEEREACARVAEETAIVGPMGLVLCRGEQIAAAIRARGG